MIKIIKSVKREDKYLSLRFKINSKTPFQDQIFLRNFKF